jgi:hypothetical protein
MIGVRIDDDVGTEQERRIDAGHERSGEPLVTEETNDVLYSERGGDGGGVIGAAVVDHDELDAIDPWNLSREPGQSFGQVLALVEAGNLDDEFQCRLTGTQR